MVVKHLGLGIIKVIVSLYLKCIVDLEKDEASLDACQSNGSKFESGALD